jgi:AraC family transcriptional regulator
VYCIMDDTTAASSGGGQLPSWQATKIRRYIDANLSGRVTVEDMALWVNLSKSHFSRAFRRTFGETPHAYVLRRRLSLASAYMMRTDFMLTDIALRCGFCDQAHLCRRFRRETGHSPAAWRRAYRLAPGAGTPI